MGVPLITPGRIFELTEFIKFQRNFGKFPVSSPLPAQLSPAGESLPFTITIINKEHLNRMPVTEAVEGFHFANVVVRFWLGRVEFCRIQFSEPDFRLPVNDPAVDAGGISSFGMRIAPPVHWLITPSVALVSG